MGDAGSMRLSVRDATLLGLGFIAALAAIAALSAGASLLTAMANGRSTEPDYAPSLVVGFAAGRWGIRALMTPLVLLALQRWPPSRSTLLVHGLVAVVWSGVHLAAQTAIELGAWRMTPSSVAWAFGENLLYDLVFYATVAAAWTALRNHRLALLRVEEEARLRRALIEARLGALRSQLNPDFVLPILGRLPLLARRGEFEAVGFALSRLADLLRARLASRDEPTADLETQIALASMAVELYVAIGETGPTLDLAIAADMRGVTVPAGALEALTRAALEARAEAVRIGARDEGGFVVVTIGARASSEAIPLRTATSEVREMISATPGAGVRTRQDGTEHLIELWLPRPAAESAVPLRLPA